MIGEILSYAFIPVIIFGLAWLLLHAQKSNEEQQYLRDKKKKSLSNN